MAEPQFQYVKLPDGSYGKFDAGASDEEIQGHIKQDFPDAFPSQHPVLDAVKDFGKGVLKSGISTMSAADDFAQKHLPAFMTTPIGQAPTAENSARAVEAAKQMATPNGTAQSIGKGIGNAAQFLIPGAAEEAGASMLAPTIGKLAARMTTGALGSGVVNAAQGGGFGSGAAAGAVGGAIGQGLKAIAPSIAESSIGIRKLDRAYGKAPGRAILDETKGFSPETVAESAQDALGKINPELERIVGNGGTSPVDLAAPRGIVQSAQNAAISKNASSSFRQLEPMARHLDTEFVTGAPIPQVVKPMDALNLKRGFGDEFIHNWNPETMSGTRGTAAQTYRALADEIHSSVPGSAELDERASSLIPVAKRADSTALNAPAGQRVLHRFGAHTGALAGGLFGANEGYKEKGIPGAIAGGLLGVALPEAVASPTGQMVLARSLNSGISATAPKILGGLGLQLLRPNDDDKNKKRDGNQ